MKTIPRREPVPLQSVPRTFVPKDDIVALLRRSPLDRHFKRDLDAIDATIDEL